jgi:hypothetical protein
MSSFLHPVTDFVRSLSIAWEREEALLRRRGLVESADHLASLTEELRKEASEWVDQPLTLAEAAERSGLSYSTLQHMVADGTVANAGEKGRPRVRRKDLPRKVAPSAAGMSRTNDADSIGKDPGLDLIEQELLEMELGG